MNQPNGNKNCQYHWRGTTCLRSGDGEHHCMLIISKDATRHEVPHKCMCLETNDDDQHTVYPEIWRDYPKPHYDEEDTCQCPDHVAMRSSRRAEGTGFNLRDFLDSW